jgi:Helix-turn-helix domain
MLEINGRLHIPSGLAADRAGVTQRYISQLAKRGSLPGRKLAGAWYVDEEALMTFIKQRAKNGSTKP